jgi:hypothetical protein
MLETPERIADEQTEPRTGWEGLIVLYAANNMDDVKRADRQMAERLTAHAPLLYVDPPMSHLTRLKSPGGRTTPLAPRRMGAPAPRVWGAPRNAWRVPPIW